MRLLLLLFLLIPALSFADLLCCSDGRFCTQGIFNGTIPNGDGMGFTFTNSDGRTVISSLNNCQVTLGADSKAKFDKQNGKTDSKGE